VSTVQFGHRSGTGDSSFGTCLGIKRGCFDTGLRRGFYVASEALPSSQEKRRTGIVSCGGLKTPVPGVTRLTSLFRGDES